jgi:23S rRNA (adenine2503-C2)-methyltransferase
MTQNSTQDLLLAYLFDELQPSERNCLEHYLISSSQLQQDLSTYARTIDYPIQYQWTLLKGINDSQEEMDNILRLFKGKFAVLNLIPYNSLEADDYQRPDGERIVEMVRYLHSRGVLTKVRNSAGQDVDGGCGQLRARAEGVAQFVALRHVQ